MSDAESADEREVVVPDDNAELLAELRRRGVRPGQRLHVRTASSGNSQSSESPARTAGSASKARRTARAPKTGRYASRHSGGGAEKAPAFFASVRSGQRDLAKRSQEILRSRFPGE